MIFDNSALTQLVRDWQQTRDQEKLAEIIKGSTGLVEAIVSMYDYHYREDMIQEARLKIVYALPFFKYKISTLHTFLTTVIHNVCKTYVKRQSNYDNLMDGEEMLAHRPEETDAVIHVEDTMLVDCICRNRQRFPSLPQNVVDGMTTFVVIAMRNNTSMSKRAVVDSLVKFYNIEKYKATTVYLSTIIYLRHKYITCADLSIKPMDEFDLENDFLYVMGDKMYKRLAVILKGITIKMP